MSDRPNYKVADNNEPFSSTGMEYFGPFVVTLFRKTETRWICLFTCSSVRALNLEVVGILDRESCFDAINRFTARWGKPQLFLLDKATNFIGAANELRRAVESLNESKMNGTLANEGKDWRFNLPRAPHFGGAWEFLVRSAKRAIFNVTGKNTLREEKLSTIVCLTEQLLSNQTLVPVSTDADNLDTVTPSQFLIGGTIYSWPQSLMSDQNVSYRQKFGTVSEQLKHLWKRWVTEFLTTLQQRKKWFSSGYSIIKAIGLVWIQDVRHSYFNYPLRRFQAVEFTEEMIESYYQRQSGHSKES